MSRTEEQYKKVRDKYDEFSCAVIMYDTNAKNKDMLVQATKELAQEVKEFWKMLRGGTEECQNKKGF